MLLGQYRQHMVSKMNNGAENRTTRNSLDVAPLRHLYKNLSCFQEKPQPCANDEIASLTQSTKISSGHLNAV